MQENEKNFNENEINEAPLNEENLIKETLFENSGESSEAKEEQTVSTDIDETAAEDLTELSLSETVTDELPSPVDNESNELEAHQDIPEEPIYIWNYDAQKKFDAEKSKKKRSRAAIIYASVMTAAFLVSFAILLVLLLTNAFDSTLAPSPQPDTTPSDSTSTSVVYVKEYTSDSGVLTTQEIYSKCLPSVVSISVSNSSSSGVGSGFIISEDGYIVTANHVVSGMTQITVILSNNQSFKATVVDGNEFTDLALIKIEKTGLPALKIGKSSSLLVGDHVVAIGTPASVDFAGSLADGTVSFNNRVFKIYTDNNVLEKKMTLIQTNALVNPGNSGCPLINQYGEVVGIVTMKLNSTYFEGMCFAIPTDTAMPIINAMKNGENYDALLSAVSKYPAKLGITGESVVINNNSIQGVKIVTFSSSSYDISKKMIAGDVITQINSTPVTSVTELSRALDAYAPGDTVKITFYRSTQKQTVNVILGK